MRRCITQDSKPNALLTELLRSCADLSGLVVRSSPQERQTWVRFLLSNCFGQESLTSYQHKNEKINYHLASDACKLYSRWLPQQLLRRLPAKHKGFDSRFLCGDFSRSSHTSDLRTGIPVATLLCSWRHSVRAWTG